MFKKYFLCLYGISLSLELAFAQESTSPGADSKSSLLPELFLHMKPHILHHHGSDVSKSRFGFLGLPSFGDFGLPDSFIGSLNKRAVTWQSCNHTAHRYPTCADCRTILKCYSSRHVESVERCTLLPWCNNGRCTARKNPNCDATSTSSTSSSSSTSSTSTSSSTSSTLTTTTAQP